MENDEGLQYCTRYTVYTYGIPVYTVHHIRTYCRLRLDYVYTVLVYLYTVCVSTLGVRAYSIYRIYLTTGISVYTVLYLLHRFRTVRTRSTISIYRYIPYIIQYKNCTRRCYFQVIYGYEGNDRSNENLRNIILWPIQIKIRTAVLGMHSTDCTWYHTVGHFGDR